MVENENIKILYLKSNPKESCKGCINIRQNRFYEKNCMRQRKTLYNDERLTC